MTDTSVLIVLHTLALLALAVVAVVLAKRLRRAEDRLDEIALEVYGLHIRKPTTREK